MATDSSWPYWYLVAGTFAHWTIVAGGALSLVYFSWKMWKQQQQQQHEAAAAAAVELQSVAVPGHDQDLKPPLNHPQLAIIIP
ncbi:uncharacterized protein PG986_010268 [Apiospora aurea]|uniref:Uncharacterized protein n=1 Tax=Apiospora aurea TaxID=335848 RepID=A0ABR1Q9Z9_9PEZI